MYGYLFFNFFHIQNKLADDSKGTEITNELTPKYAIY